MQEFSLFSSVISHRLSLSKFGHSARCVRERPAISWRQNQVIFNNYSVSPQNRARILWPITFTNIDQYQCRLIELFLQHFLTIYHKYYSHSKIPAAATVAITVAMATSALVQTNVCAITAHRPIVYVPPSSICARPHLIWFLPTSGHLNPVDYRIWGCLQDPCLSEAHTQHQWAETAPGWCMVRLRGQTVIGRAIDEWRKRLQACVRIKGHRFEHVL